MSDNKPTTHPRSNEEYLLVALRHALRPLIGFLLHRGVTFPVFSNLIRSLYVEQAQREFPTAGKPMPDSKLSLVTGIARRYVKEIRKEQVTELQAGAKSSPGARVIAEWLTDPDYLDADGKPACISRTADKNNIPNFETLARRVNSDVWPPTLLESLTDMGLVKINHDGKIQLLNNAYLPGSKSKESLKIFSHHIHDHLAATRNNLLNLKPLLVERSAYEGNLTTESVVEIQQFTDKKTADLLQEIYNLAAKRSRTDLGTEGATNRIRVGVYFYSEDVQNGDP